MGEGRFSQHLSAAHCLRVTVPVSLCHNQSQSHSPLCAVSGPSRSAQSKSHKPLRPPLALPRLFHFAGLLLLLYCCRKRDPSNRNLCGACEPGSEHGFSVFMLISGEASAKMARHMAPQGGCRHQGGSGTMDKATVPSMAGTSKNLAQENHCDQWTTLGAIAS